MSDYRLLTHAPYSKYQYTGAGRDGRFITVERFSTAIGNWRATYVRTRTHKGYAANITTADGLTRQAAVDNLLSKLADV